MRLPNRELEKLRMEHEKKEAEQARQRAEEQYWKELEHQYAGMAMHGLIVTSSKRMGTDQEGAQWAIELAHALVEKIKEERE